MGNELISGVVTVALAITGIAMVAVLVSRNANTANVITAGASGLATGIAAAVSPLQTTGWTGGQPIDLGSF